MLGLVFAAGLGTRLRPLTDRLPKPVVPLMNRPLASHSVERLAALGIRRIAINTHHRADDVERELAPFAPPGVELVFLREAELLGTGGGLRNAMRALDANEEVVVMNGDILYWPDLEGAIQKHRENKAIATMVLRSDPRARKLGAIEIDAGGRVRTLLATAPDAELSEYMFTGVHVISPRALDDLPERGCIIRSAYRAWVERRDALFGFADESSWRDLGTPRDYLGAHLDALAGTLRWPSWKGPIAESAVIDAGAKLGAVVIGDGARIGACSLDRCVVWKGSEVREDAHDAIVAGDLRVVLAE
jgi:mannose-1-phosphate guanylyltransferase